MTNNKSITIVLFGSKGKGKKSFSSYIFNHDEKNLKNQAYERCTENIICYKEKKSEDENLFNIDIPGPMIIKNEKENL
jgi:predicted GTPase